MTRQTSIKRALRQQLSQLNELGNEQLNNLLEKLEHQKQNLPIEEHSIIDWGLSVIRAKALEKEQLKKKMCQQLESRYYDYKIFVKNSGLEKLNLKNDVDREEFYNVGMNHLDEILIISCQEKDDRCLDYVNNVKNHLDRFCRERGEIELFKVVIENYACHYDSYTLDPEYPIIKEFSKKQAQYLRGQQIY